MKSPAPADLQRWSEEVARDAASLAFVPLARAYRRQGRRDAALRLCLRGLEHHPSHVEGHALLAILYFESGHRLKAYDEWSMVLTLDPDNFDALRGMGFYYLEQDDHDAAVRHLERAAAQKPSDPAVREALRIIRERQGQALPTKTVEIAAVAAPQTLEPWQQESVGWAPEPPAAAPAEPQLRNGVRARGASVATPVDPIRLFDPVLRGGQVLGALLLDAQGLVLAGSLGGELGRSAEALGAILSVAIQEASRTATHLALGPWKGVLLEADSAVLHLAPVQQNKIVLLAAHRHAPAGWVLHSAQHAATLATRFLESEL
jgi:tetratricopeptide (TPR) repeat protein